MPSFSGSGPKATSPVEDLQKLYNEVWVQFAKGKPSESSYAHNIDPTIARSRSQPTIQQTGSFPSSSPHLINTSPSISNSPASAALSNMSPTRRRLPPTPGESSASVKPPSTYYSMSEPGLYTNSYPNPMTSTSSATNLSKSGTSAYRPSGASPPATPSKPKPKPSAYCGVSLEPQFASYHQESLKAYGHGNRHVSDEYQDESFQEQESAPSRYSKPVPALPPPSPLPNLSSNVQGQYLDHPSCFKVAPQEKREAAHSTLSKIVSPEHETWPFSFNPLLEHVHQNKAGRQGGAFVRRPALHLPDEPQYENWEDRNEDGETRCVRFSLQYHITMQLRDKLPLGTRVEGSTPSPRALMGKDIVIQRELAIDHDALTDDRRIALQVARSLQSHLVPSEVEWGVCVLRYGVENIYSFEDHETGSDAEPEKGELSTGVIPKLTECYSPICGEGIPCYSYTCPQKQTNCAVEPHGRHVGNPVVGQTIDSTVINLLPQHEVNRQAAIHELIIKEKQYLQDLDLVESAFVQPLRAANPPILPTQLWEGFVNDVFGNIFDIRECNRHLLEAINSRQREEGSIIRRIGDIFLQAATEFRLVYPPYVGQYPMSEKRLKEECDNNSALRLILEQCSREQSSPSREPPRLDRLDLRDFLNRPVEHLQDYTVLLEAVHLHTAADNPDAELLVEAIVAIKNLQFLARLRTFQSAMGKGVTENWEWHDLVSAGVREQITKPEAKRQSTIFELIKGEMDYVKDLENIYNIYVVPLREAEPPIIPRDRLDEFIADVFHNYGELYEHHRKLLDKFHEIQREQHPHIRSITAALFDTALNFREAYMEYIPNYPIAAYRIDGEEANNLTFKTFVEQCTGHADAHRLNIKNFVYRPIPRLPRYVLFLEEILKETPAGHDDLESIPTVLEVIKSLIKETEPGVFSAEQKVKVWQYHANLVFRPGDSIDMNLLDENRSLIHAGKLFRQPDGALHVLLFDNYLVMTKPKEKEGVTKYHVNRRPIPLDLLTLVNFTDPPTQRSARILRNLRGGEWHDGTSVGPAILPDSPTDSRSGYPLTLHHGGRAGGPHILYAESAQSRTEWKQKLGEALGLRKAVQESNNVFEIEYLNRDTFIMPSVAVSAEGPAWNQDSRFTGKVTCSVPFSTRDGRKLVAIGCTEGVWIGFRHDPKSICRVLHLKMVTQCAILEDFGIFLVLADNALFAYDMETLVPSSSHGARPAQVPQKLSSTKDVQFFSAGALQGRTLVIYMKKQSLNSVFRVLEPVGNRINERVNVRVVRSTKSEWFRVYRDFFLPSDSFDVIFLNVRIAIFCAKGIEILNLHDFDSITIPQREDPRHAQLAKRCESARPLGMFRSADEEFLLCYDEFGLHVDKHGDPCRSFGTIEWEGTANRAAFHPPYILLFDFRFIEVRHVETGRLVQIIPGNEVRCTWDGRGVSGKVTPPAIDSGEEDGLAMEARVHFVLNGTDSTPGPGDMLLRNITQHVCELIPTVPLLPLRRSAPSAASVQSSQPTELLYRQY